jgi:hypothetical protein
MMDWTGLLDLGKMQLGNHRERSFHYFISYLALRQWLLEGITRVVKTLGSLSHSLTLASDYIQALRIVVTRGVLQAIPRYHIIKIKRDAALCMQSTKVGELVMS